jgi:uncharacterized protein YpmS
MKTKTNKWKTGFWVYFAISLIIILYLFASKANNEVELAFTKFSKIYFEKDIKIITEALNNGDLSKNGILTEISKDSFYKIDKTDDNKIELERIILFFENDTLIRIENKKDILDFK